MCVRRDRSCFNNIFSVIKSTLNVEFPLINCGDTTLYSMIVRDDSISGSYSVLGAALRTIGGISHSRSV